MEWNATRSSARERVRADDVLRVTIARVIRVETTHTRQASERPLPRSMFLRSVNHPPVPLVTLQYSTGQYMTLHSITFHHITLQFITLQRHGFSVVALSFADVTDGGVCGAVLRTLRIDGYSQWFSKGRRS